MLSLQPKKEKAQSWPELAEASKKLVEELKKIGTEKRSSNYYLRDIGMPEPRKVNVEPNKTIVQ